MGHPSALIFPSQLCPVALSLQATAPRCPRPAAPELTAQGSAPPHCGPATHGAAGDALVNEGVPVLLIGAVVHGIPPGVRPIHGCGTGGE